MEKTRHDSAVRSGILSLKQFLRAYNLGEDDSIKLIKHSNHSHYRWKHSPALKSGEIDIETIYQKGLLDLFQSAQAKDKFGKGTLLSFIAEKGRLARFVGGYRVPNERTNKGTRATSTRAIAAFEEGFYDPSRELWCELERNEELDFLADRLVILWPLQGRDNRFLMDGFEVAELRPKGSYRPFPGFDNLILSFSELKTVTKSNENVGWYNPLKSTRGVYLITNASNGDLYVGSATGAEGFWGRWSQYAKDGHGSNKLLKEGIANKALDPQQFQYSILETLSNLANNEEGLQAEQLWKRKLGNKATTLNGN